jgi:hypothetical protein
LCSDMGENFIQLWWCTGVEELFLVYGVLVVGEWLPSDGTDYILSWNYCTHLGKSS